MGGRKTQAFASISLWMCFYDVKNRGKNWSIHALAACGAARVSTLREVSTAMLGRMSFEQITKIRYTKVLSLTTHSIRIKSTRYPRCYRGFRKSLHSTIAPADWRTGERNARRYVKNAYLKVHCIYVFFTKKPCNTQGQWNTPAGLYKMSVYYVCQSYHSREACSP